MLPALSRSAIRVAMVAIPLALCLAACDSGRAQPTATIDTRAAPAGEPFACTPIKLWDGDGPIHCAEGPKIRLAGIVARELRWTGSEMVDAGCNEGHPCPTSSALEAREYLGNLLSGNVVVQFAPEPTGHLKLTGPKLSCTSDGSAGGSRTWCVSPVHGDLSCRMVKSGHAARWDRYWKDHRC